jgi:hypothetical protein
MERPLQLPMLSMQQVEGLPRKCTNLKMHTHQTSAKESWCVQVFAPTPLRCHLLLQMPLSKR